LTKVFVANISLRAVNSHASSGLPERFFSPKTTNDVARPLLKGTPGLDVRARHPIGVILLARLAVDRTERGAGLGKTMLVDALSWARTAADAIGARAMLVHPIDEDAVAFYRKFGFEQSPLDLKQLMLMKDLTIAATRLNELRDADAWTSRDRD
jgi:GNAT superfamily N-acetyltransferase